LQSSAGHLAQLCYHHHWRVHEGGWQLVRTDEGKILTIAPRFHLYQLLARTPDVAAA